MKRRSFLSRSTALIGGLGLSSISYAFTNEKKALLPYLISTPILFTGNKLPGT